MADHLETEARPERRIPVDLSQPLVLQVHSPAGNVTVRAADRSDVFISDLTGGEAELMIDVQENRIEVRPHPRFGDWAGGDFDFDAVFGQIAKAFRWGGAWSSAKPGKGRGVFGHVGWPDIAIEVPRTMSGRCEVHTASGDVHVDGVTGEIALHSMSGNHRVVRTSGDLNLQTASGDMGIESAAGRLSAHSASGDIRVISSRIEGFQVQTASGDISFDAMLLGAGSSRVQTASGDIRLTLRQPVNEGGEPAATVAFHTVSGDAHVRPPFRRTDRRLWQSAAGDSGPRIDVTSVSGDLTAEFAAAESGVAPVAAPAARRVDLDPAPPAPLAPPAAPLPPTPTPNSTVAQTGGVSEDAARQDTGPAQSEAHRLAVLEAVERGEIDVEEALRRLEAADPLAGP